MFCKPLNKPRILSGIILQVDVQGHIRIFQVQKSIPGWCQPPSPCRAPFAHHLVLGKMVIHPYLHTYLCPSPYAPPKTNIDTQNDGPWKRRFPFKNGNFWYQFVRFLGCKAVASGSRAQTSRKSFLGGSWNPRETHRPGPVWAAGFFHGVNRVSFPGCWLVANKGVLVGISH